MWTQSSWRLVAWDGSSTSHWVKVTRELSDHSNSIWFLRSLKPIQSTSVDTANVMNARWGTMFDVFRRKEMHADVHTYSIQTGTEQSSAPLCCGYWPSLRPLYDRQPMHPSRSSFCFSPSNNSCLRREPSDWGRKWAALWLHMKIETRKRCNSSTIFKENLAFFFLCIWHLRGSVGRLLVVPLRQT